MHHGIRNAYIFPLYQNNRSQVASLDFQAHINAYNRAKSAMGRNYEEGSVSIYMFSASDHQQAEYTLCPTLITLWLLRIEYVVLLP